MQPRRRKKNGGSCEPPSLAGKGGGTEPNPAFTLKLGKMDDRGVTNGQPRPGRFQRYIAIFPPPSFVITSTEGRGGIPSSKSGQRVDGSSK